MDSTAARNRSSGGSGASSGPSGFMLGASAQPSSAAMSVARVIGSNGLGMTPASRSDRHSSQILRRHLGGQEDDRECPEWPGRPAARPPLRVRRRRASSRRARSRRGARSAPAAEPAARTAQSAPPSRRPAPRRSAPPHAAARRHRRPEPAWSPKQLQLRWPGPPATGLHVEASHAGTPFAEVLAGPRYRRAHGIAESDGSVACMEGLSGPQEAGAWRFRRFALAAALIVALFAAVLLSPVPPAAKLVGHRDRAGRRRPGDGGRLLGGSPG